MERKRVVWQDAAKCLSGAPTSEADCIGCPVKKQCRDYGILHEEFEIYGGMSGPKRKTWRKAFKNKYEALVIDSIENQWLEPHNLVDRDLLSELQAYVSLVEVEDEEVVVNPHVTTFNVTMPNLDWLSRQQTA